MKKMLNFFRSNIGRKSVPPRHREHMHEISTALAHLYHDDVFEFEINEKKKSCETNQTGTKKNRALVKKKPKCHQEQQTAPKEKRYVIWADAEALLDEVIDRRELCGKYTVKLMADGGQGFFKISLTIQPESDPDECEFNTQTCTPKRTLYAEGGTVGQEPKLSSVHRLIILCLVPDIKESYDNLKILFDLTKVNNIPFKFASDIKVLLLVNGQQTASASFPCPYCSISLNLLKNYEGIKIENQENFESDQEKPQGLKTYGDLKRNYKHFCFLGSKKEMAKEAGSTIHEAIFQENDDVHVIEKCVIPELHVMQGFVNHMFWKGLVPLLGRERALKWPNGLNLVSANYHGEAFEGNACRELLKNSEKLDNPEIYGDVGKIGVMPFISAFQSMNKVVKNCFSTRRCDDLALERLLHELKKMVLATGVSITPKLHILLDHLRESLDFLDDNVGLGFWSEQAGESIHHEFVQIWNKYKVKSPNNPSYGPRLKRTVVEFSSTHI